jgi:hypothetical protein
MRWRRQPLVCVLGGHALLADAADQAGLPWMDIVITLSLIASSGAVLYSRHQDRGCRWSAACLPSLAFPEH